MKGVLYNPKIFRTVASLSDIVSRHTQDLFLLTAWKKEEVNIWLKERKSERKRGRKNMKKGEEGWGNKLKSRSRKLQSEERKEKYIWFNSWVRQRMTKTFFLRYLIGLAHVGKKRSLSPDSRINGKAKLQYTLSWEYLVLSKGANYFDCH